MEEAAKKTSRVRSPGYPMIDLKEAIDKAKELWNKDKMNPIPREVVAKHLGYENAGGYGGRVIAALKHFDLISFKEGDIILTEKALDLALHSPDDKIYQDIIKEIALKPDTYADIFNDFKVSEISDATLRVKLIKDYKFNADKVDRFISNFRSTIDFAGLTETEERREEEDNMQTQDRRLPVTRDTVPSTAKTPGTAAMTPATAIKHYPIPLSKGKTAVIGFESLPVRKKDIEVIKKWLELFEGSLTESDKEGGDMNEH